MKNQDKDKTTEETETNNKLNERFNESDRQMEMGVSHLGFSYFLDNHEQNEGVESDLRNNR